MSTETMGQTGTEPLALVIEGRDTVIAYACGKCGRVCSPLIYACGPERAMAAAREHAAECCQPRKCEDCGGETEHRSRLRCQGCEGKRSDQRERERFEAATVVEWDGGAMLYDEENDRWISWPDEADDFGTRYAYATTPRGLHLDAARIVEDALEDGEHHDDAHEQISDEETAELQAFLDGWAARTGVVSYFPDYSRVVLFTDRDEIYPRGETDARASSGATDE